MAGWPFGDFYLDPKCVAFSGGVVLAYMYLPCRYDPNWVITASGLAVASYLGLAWYDDTYGCDKDSNLL